jgi:hypothetical protein
MIMTPIKPATSTEHPELGTLDDVSADLDTSETFSRAAERIVSDIRECLRSGIAFSGEHALEQLNDLESLIIEAREKAKASRIAVIAFHEAEFDARRSHNG